MNALGPMGMTPLMVAAVRGDGIDTGDGESEDDGTAQIIAELVAQGAQLNPTLDTTGKLKFSFLVQETLE